ncbi:MAG: hypothetical protein GTO12_07095 [Proteobacteria bacterium]|nr:hypothetical protein [Pseudomonadota bacterium]
MNVYEHFFWNFAIFNRKPWAWKVGLGGILPDLIYLFPFLPKMLTYETFMEWMHDPLWQTIWNSSIAKSAHSFVIWGGTSLFFLAILRRKVFSRVSPFLWGWGLHILFDALTHVSDGYALFYPLSDFRFPTPVSYWEKTYYGREFFWISHFLMAALLLYWAGSKLARLWTGKREKSQGEEKPGKKPTGEVTI